MSGRRRTAARAGWGFLDQALSSLTNFVLGFVVARTFSPSDLGAFALVFNVYLFFLNVVRPLAMEPLLIVMSGSAHEPWRRATGAAVGLSLVIALLAGLGIYVAGVVAGGVLGQGLLVVGILLPGLLVQDSWRLAFFAAERGRDAFLNDLVWAVVLLPGMYIAVAILQLGIPGLIAVWGIAAAIAAVVGILQSGTFPRPDRSIGWFLEQRALAVPLTIESIASVGLAQVASFGIAAVAGLSAVGALRAGQLLLGPLFVVSQGFALIAIPEGKRFLRRSLATLRRAVVLSAVVLAALTLAWGGLVLVLPDPVGQEILHLNWAPARQVVGLQCLALAAGLVSSAMGVGMRALGAARRVLWAGLASSTIRAVLDVVGAAVGAAAGAAAGDACANAVGIVISGRQFRAAMREYAADAVGPTSTNL